jgi:hypothetical protein
MGSGLLVSLSYFHPKESKTRAFTLKANKKRVSYYLNKIKKANGPMMEISFNYSNSSLISFVRWGILSPIMGIVEGWNCTSWTI